MKLRGGRLRDIQRTTRAMGRGGRMRRRNTGCVSQHDSDNRLAELIDLLAIFAKVSDRDPILRQ